MSASQRTDQLRSRLLELDANVGLLTDRQDIRWLTGFTGSNAAMLIRPETVLFFTDFRYAEQARDQLAPGFELVIADGPLRNEFGKALERGDAVVYDAAAMSVLELGLLEEVLVDGIDMRAVEGLAAPLRARKDAAEIAAIAAACALADEAFESVIGRGLIGRTELNVAIDLELEARRLGAAGMSFAPIVAGGGHGALPHAEPRDVEIAPDVLVVIDWGVVLDGYCSDCTRTVATGDLDDRAREVYGLVNRAREVGIEAVAPGADCRAVDSAARGVIDNAGFGERFGHGLGHGVGLDVHEAPTLGKRGRGSLAEGMTVTVEPGIYLPGEFGVRIEDLVAVTGGGARLLTSLERELRQVD